MKSDVHENKRDFNSSTLLTSLLLLEHKMILCYRKKKKPGKQDNTSEAIEGQIIVRFIPRKAAVTVISDPIILSQSCSCHVQ